jgi:hypothetical protein
MRVALRAFDLGEKLGVNAIIVPEGEMPIGARAHAYARILFER